jgi:colicin import membrane protein
VRAAASYLRSSAFSRSSLIKQLLFEGYSQADAEFAVDAQQADWRANAVRAAASYLRSSAFSRSSLIKQLLFEGYSQADAEFAVTSAGL